MRVSTMTSQRTRSWNVPRRQLAKGVSEYVRNTLFFTLHEGSIQKFILKCVRYIYIFKQVGIRGNTMMKL